MITFKGRQQVLKSADTIQRRAHSVYPHISGSKLKKRIHHVYGIPEPTLKQMPEFFQVVVSKIQTMRDALRSSDKIYPELISEMQEKRVGNCIEDALLAQLIGKLNGQKNIYVGNIVVEKERVEKKKNIDHAVAFVTNKKIKSGEEYSFKNKDAIIIDPWLNLVDFAGDYFTKIKYQYRKLFKELPDRDFLEYLIGTDSKNTKDFRERRKNSCQHLTFNIVSIKDIEVDKKKKQLYKSFFPELVIKKYKKIELPKETKPKNIAKKQIL